MGTTKFSFILILFSTSYSYAQLINKDVERLHKTTVKESKSASVLMQEPEVKEVLINQQNNAEEAEQPVKSPLNDENQFIPIPAEGYTDENYQLNIEKSKKQEENLNAPAMQHSEKEKEATIDVEIQRYIKERDKYPKGSYEYESIQQKINHLEDKQ